jgi:hypothetical protein
MKVHRNCTLYRSERPEAEITQCMTLHVLEGDQKKTQIVEGFTHLLIYFTGTNKVWEEV